MSDDEADDDLGDDDDDDDNDNDDAGFSRKGMEWGEKRANLSLDVGDDDGDGDGDGHHHDNDLVSDAWLFPGQHEQQQQQQQKQKLLLRFSCADSLDRTNLASFFVALQFVGEVKTCDILQCALRIMHGVNEW